MSVEQYKFQNCKSCLVYGTNNLPLAEGRVISTGNSLILILNNQKLRDANVSTIVEFRDSVKGVIRCICKLHIRRNEQVCNTGEPWAADCTIVRVLETLQRQHDLRVPMNISALCTKEDNRMFRINILNLSAGGMMCTTTVPMSNGTKFKMEYTFGGELCKLTAQILRGRKVNGLCRYNCQFIDTPNKYESIIRRYVMDINKESTVNSFAV